MNRLLPIAVLAVFSIYSIYVVYAFGYLAVFRFHLSNIGGIQVICDLVIALTLVMVWMVGDARRHGRTVWPFIVATLALGSIGPLAYLATAPRAAGA